MKASAALSLVWWAFMPSATCPCAELLLAFYNTNAEKHNMADPKVVDDKELKELVRKVDTLHADEGMAHFRMYHYIRWMQQQHKHVTVVGAPGGQHQVAKRPRAAAVQWVVVAAGSAQHWSAQHPDVAMHVVQCAAALTSQGLTAGPKEVLQAVSVLGTASGASNVETRAGSMVFQRRLTASNVTGTLQRGGVKAKLFGSIPIDL